MIDTIANTVIGAIAGAIAGHYSATRLYSKKRFNNACDDLHEAFSEELRLLNAGDQDAYEILNPARNKHERAVNKFKRVLTNKTTLREFEQAWEEYSSVNGIPHLEQYAAVGSIDERRNLVKLALQRLNKLLSFAKTNK